MCYFSALSVAPGKHATDCVQWVLAEKDFSAWLAWDRQHHLNYGKICTRQQLCKLVGLVPWGTSVMRVRQSPQLANEAPQLYRKAEKQRWTACLAVQDGTAA